ncbi:TlpA disulfide reductase family protein [Parvibaculum sp.]|uniref:TlpA family protein disulfide reductase n=1 Tax=Parvibaculum sp. TaxID=2024848 RepID=UPI0025D742EB|nr:TlpA disulfide reductase family protein [Parvibaculum sp.]
MIAGPQINGSGGTGGSGGGSSPLAGYVTGPVGNFQPAATPEPVPDLEFHDKDGKTVHLSDFRGRLVLLNLWATWCVPCREEMSALDGLQAALGSDRFQVLALSVDKDGLELARAFLKEVKAGHLGLYNDPTSGANFKVRGYGLPTTLLVSPDGKELGRIVGPAEWNAPEAHALIEAAIKLSGR